MHDECVKQLRVAEEKLVEGYGVFVEKMKEEVGGEDVNEGVGGLFRKDEEGEVVEKVDFSGMKLRIFPEEVGKMKGLVVINLANNQLQVFILFKVLLSIYFYLCVYLAKPFWSFVCI